MIAVENLVKDYGPVRAVDNASFSVAPGETVGFLGPNGAGKTTTMRIMTGLFPPTAGDVTVDGVSILEDPLAVKQRIGYLPENTPVYLDMTVESYLRFVAEIKGVPSARRRAQVDAAVAACALESVSRRATRKLSKGFRQRLGLAQALIGDPPVIILDEPTVGLDPTQTFEFRKLIRDLKGERTIILSTHILAEVSMICDRVVIISKGRIVAQDTPDELARNLRPVVELLVSVDGARTDVTTARLAGLEGVASVVQEKPLESGGAQYRVRSVPDADPRQQIVTTVVAEGWQLLELVRVSAGLEEVFLNLVTEESPSVFSSSGSPLEEVD